MASYDPYERDAPRRYVREERRDDRDPRFLDSRDYGRPVVSRELVPRAREDSDLSVEEIRRDFPPPSGRDIRRARSADHDRGGYYDDDYDYRHDPRYDRSRERDHDRHLRRGGSYYEEEERRSKHKSMSKQEKIIAAVAGAALLAGGKEIYDRYEAKQDGVEVHRNPLSSVALAGFGALAGYQGAEFYSKQQAKKDQKTNYILHRGRDGQITEYYSEDEDDKHKKGHKNFLESALAATGLGAAVKTLTGGGKDDDRHSDNRSRGGSPSRSRAGSPRSRTSGSGANKMQKAAMASLLAGATEAFRVAKEPGGWKGEKTKRILTAAAGAATVDAAQGENHGKLGLAESVIGGLVGNRLINGSKKDIEEDKATGRSRSRSRARSQGGNGGGGSGLAALATAGLGALGAKAALDHRSRSRSRADSRGRSYDSRDGSPDRRQRSRSRSVVDKARNSLAKLGIGSGAVAVADDHRRRDQDDFDDRGSSRRSRRYSDEYSDDGRHGGGRSRGGDDYGYDRRGGGGRRDSSRRRGGSRYGSDSDLGDSDEDERKARKMRGKQIITTGLATVASIHAVHGVYQSVGKRNARQRAVKEGRLSPAEAKKLKTKAIMKDAASVGIAAMGIKGAIEEMKEAKEMTHECKVFKQEKALRHEKREKRRQRGNGPGDTPRRAESWAPSRYRDEDDLYRSDYGPRYYDDNPYGSGRLPAPPMGYGR
ncbi:hypothetical protein VFPPC_05545 [Pochonia chlamydosporia 170]|uniref:DUF3824 domain-containing protein n=1 Tax=Pochonia chlamydosporia 170 TaxID=1380566 RepID=A0A179FF57_METCM|nr:hypothetical protein VFPPC_05545 [Pochonia chlamydosporia 170]OAQ64235.1 hypothetical protein VFPPC_05545 [Pochonia chlamydosporia 170]